MEKSHFIRDDVVVWLSKTTKRTVYIRFARDNIIFWNSDAFRPNPYDYLETYGKYSANIELKRENLSDG